MESLISLNHSELRHISPLRLIDHRLAKIASKNSLVRLESTKRSISNMGTRNQRPSLHSILAHASKKTGQITAALPKLAVNPQLFNRGKRFSPQYNSPERQGEKAENIHAQNRERLSLHRRRETLVPRLDPLEGPQREIAPADISERELKDTPLKVTQNSAPEPQRICKQKKAFRIKKTLTRIDLIRNPEEQPNSSLC